MLVSHSVGDPLDPDEPVLRPILDPEFPEPILFPLPNTLRTSVNLKHIRGYYEKLTCYFRCYFHLHFRSLVLYEQKVT
jgi:hypothetical protein